MTETTALKFMPAWSGDVDDLAVADQGSYYTILGVGGDPMEWVNGYEKVMAEQGIGKPTAWFITTGLEVNQYTQPRDFNDGFKPDLTVLLFPLDGLDVGRLAMFKLLMQDRWFDDVVANIPSNTRAWSRPDEADDEEDEDLDDEGNFPRMEP